MKEPMSGLPGLDLAVLDRVRLSRDPRFDGRFFIAIETTGIFCRPICPSPTANARNVVYFATAASAAAAGFRPCLRCRPEAAPGTAAWAGTSAVVGRALRLIHDGQLDEGSVAMLAERVGIGPRHLHRLFVRHLGASPLVVAQHRRVQFAKHLLDETDLPVGEIAAAARFGSVRRFNDAFRRTYRLAPRELRRRRRGGHARHDAHAITLELPYRPPYAWAEMRDFLAARAIPGVERVDERGYWRTLAAQSGHALVGVRPSRGRHALELQVQGAAPVELLPITAAVRRAFDLSADPLLIASAFAREPRLRALGRRQRGLRIPGAWSGFECAVWGVLEQHTDAAAARTLAGRLVRRAGRPITTGVDGLTHLFPVPEALAAADLAGLGMGDACATALQRLAREVLRRAIDFSAPSDELRRTLAALPGLGAWGAEYVALRAQGQPDAFPADDLALRRAAAGGPRPLTPRKLAEAAESWRPWRGYAAVHLWAAANGDHRLAARAVRRASMRAPELGPARES
jgi:AraC family transcriptional regulator of adaptative response / DNA-3-methyladenine glycosylase II